MTPTISTPQSTTTPKAKPKRLRTRPNLSDRSCASRPLYDVRTFSVFDTFLGHAVTGPLAERGVQLEQDSVNATDWSTWRTAHPETTVLVEQPALGRDFDFGNDRSIAGRNRVRRIVAVPSFRDRAWHLP
ncbi:MAG: DUF3179 domain-containing (seleno)protein [Pelagibaca sp.]